MVRINSNKERIQRKAAEAAAGEAEKAEKKKLTTRKTTTRKKTTESVIRQKIVWKVFDANYREVACFPYIEKTKAYLTADALTKKKNVNHFVNEVNVPMEES